MAKGLFKKILEDELGVEKANTIPKSFDIVGDIAVIRLPEEAKKYKRTVAEAIMKVDKHVKTVLNQVSPVHGTLRLRELEWVAGERRTETIHHEFGCAYKVDLTKAYFSPRLSYERNRIAMLVKPGEIVVNMFAGVGCYSIIIAKKSKAAKIYSIDINPDAVRLMKENVKLNRVEYRVIPILGDAERVIEEKLRGIADRVLMPLPERAYDYIEVANSALRPDGGWIHYYDFIHARKDEDPRRKTIEKTSERLEELGIKFEIPFSRVVRNVGPNWYQVVLDILIFRGT